MYNIIFVIVTIIYLFYPTDLTGWYHYTYNMLYILIHLPNVILLVHECTNMKIMYIIIYFHIYLCIFIHYP